MTRVNFDRVLPFAADKLFEMVGDVEKYPDYIPWITSMRVTNRTTMSDTVTRMDAEAGVGFKFLSERFSTRVTRDAEGRTIDIVLLRGPFKKLVCRWTFEDADFMGMPGGCKASLDMDFEFKNPFLTGFLRANFDKAVAKLMACFEGRAATLYPKAG